MHIHHRILRRHLSKVYLVGFYNSAKDCSWSPTIPAGSSASPGFTKQKNKHTRQIDRVFVDIIQNTLLQNTLPPFPLPRASLNWSTNHVFSFWRDQNLDVIPKLFPTSFLKTSRQAHNPAATCPQTSSDAEATILDPPFDWCLVLLRFPFLQGSWKYYMGNKELHALVTCPFSYSAFGEQRKRKDVLSK